MKKREFEIIRFLCGTLIGVSLAACVVGILCVVTCPKLQRIDVSSTPVYVSKTITYINKVTTMEPEILTVDTLEETPDDLEAEAWYDSLEYVAMCVQAEAGNQSELGKRLVCDVILNRYDSGEYKDLYGVIDEDGEFSVVSDGSILTAQPTPDVYRIVSEELENRTNNEVLYFRTKHYHTFGTPLFKEDDHYFSK